MPEPKEMIASSEFDVLDAAVSDQSQNDNNVDNIVEETSRQMPRYDVKTDDVVPRVATTSKRVPVETASQVRCAVTSANVTRYKGQ